MTTWVLVMWIGGYYGKSIATVSGYRSEAACKAAIAVLYAPETRKNPMDAVCIPGPPL